MPVLDAATPDERRQHERLELHRCLADEQHPAFREAVAQHASDRRQQQDRGELQRAHEPELEGGLGQLQDEPGLRDTLHPRADLRDELADPE